MRTPGGPASRRAIRGTTRSGPGLNEAGITLVVHGGDSSYAAYEQLWGLSRRDRGLPRPGALKRLLSASPIRDLMASLMADQVFERLPEHPASPPSRPAPSWVAPLLKKLETISIQMPGEFAQDPYELFLDHVWVSPFFEDDVYSLVNVVGASRVLFGSDYPHAEGLAVPADFGKEIDDLPDGDVRKIMRDNARALVTPRTR